MAKLGYRAVSDISACRPVLYAATFALLAICAASTTAAGAPITADRSQAAARGPKPGVPVSNPVANQYVTDAKRALKSANAQLAITLLRNATKAAPRDGEARALLGWVLLNFGDDPVSAERELRRARQDGASEQFVLAALFDAMVARHEEDKLLEEFPEPAANAPNAADILRGRALALQALGRSIEAAAAMDRSLTLRRDVSGLLARAQIAAKQNDLTLEGKLADEVLKLEPTNGRALRAKLIVLWRSNDTAKALALSEKILRQFPSNIPATLVRIEIFLKLNQDGKAKAEVDRLLAKLPRALNVVFYRAVLLARAKDAKAAWRIAQTLPPDFVQERPALAKQVAEMAIRVGNVDTGAGILAGALSRSPGELDLRLRLAEVRMTQNSPQAALGVLLPIKDSKDPRALALLAQAYEKVGRLSEAGTALGTLGAMNLKAKDIRGALESLTHAHSLLPSDGEISFHLVQALDASGNRISARGLLKALLETGVEFEDRSAAQQLVKSWH